MVSKSCFLLKTIFISITVIQVYDLDRVSNTRNDFKDKEILIFNIKSAYKCLLNLLRSEFDLIFTNLILAW